MASNTALTITSITLVAALVAGCSDCSPSYARQATSPDGAFVAAAYSLECGPVAPFDWRVGVRRASEKSYREIVSIHDAGFEADVRWQGNDKLLVTFECPSNAAAACAPPTERSWSVSSSPRWMEVSITYAIGPRLAAVLTPEARAKLPR